MYAIIADWDAQMRVSRYNYVEAEAEAVAIVDKLRGIGDGSLPVEKQAPNAYYVLMPPAPTGTAPFQHRARFWKADPANGKVSFDTAACHAWQSKVTGNAIDAEADSRIDRVFSSDNPTRAQRIRAEMPEGVTKVELANRASALRATAQSLKDGLVDKTPEDILGFDVSHTDNWPE